MLDRRSIPLAKVAGFGWGWHGLTVQPRLTSNVTVYLPNGRTYVGSWTGRQRVIVVFGWTYLWDVGLPGLEPTEAEIERGVSFDGRAILRGFGGPLYAYGNCYFGTGLPGEMCGWPVRSGDQTGRCLMSPSADPEILELLVYPSVVLGGEPLSPVTLSVPFALDQIGQGADQPDLYEGPEELAPLVEGLRVYVLDMSRDGRSLLLGLAPAVTTTNLIRMTNVARWCGLLRLDITGDFSQPGTIGYQLTIEQDRRQALGDLVDNLTGSMANVQRYTNPRETVSTVKPWPECGVEEIVQRAGFTTTPNSSPPAPSIEGTATYRHGQTGVMAGAWFDASGAVKVVRFDSMLEQQLETTVTDGSSGERREKRVWTASATDCVAGDQVITDDSVYRLNGQISDVSTYRLTLHGEGGVFDEHMLKVTSTTTDSYDSSREDFSQSFGRLIVEVNGAVVYDETSPIEGGTLVPGSGSPFGYHLRTLLSRYHAEVGGLSADMHQIRVLNGSNKVILLGHLERTQGGPDPVTFSKALTPAGGIDGSITRYADHDTGLQPRYGFDSVDATTLTNASYNPITHQVERHREDRAKFTWL